MKTNVNQPDMFDDVSLIKPKAGTDAGLQAMLDGGVVLRTTEPTEAAQEASEILWQSKQRSNGLLKIATEFRKGMLGSKPSKQECLKVSAALAGYLGFCGYDCEVTEGKVGKWEHFWITLTDGRIVDATADQFQKPDGTSMPPVHIGAKPDWYLQEASDIIKRAALYHEKYKPWSKT